MSSALRIGPWSLILAIDISDAKREKKLVGLYSVPIPQAPR